MSRASSGTKDQTLCTEYESPQIHFLESYGPSQAPPALLQETSTPASVATSPTGTAKSGSPFESALDSRATLEHRLRSTPRMYRAFPEPGSPPSGQRGAVAWQEVEELECPVASSQVACGPG